MSGFSEMQGKPKTGETVTLTGYKEDPVTHFFEGPTAFLDFVAKRPEWQKTEDMKSTQRDDSAEPYAGTATWEEAVKLARLGWPEGVRSISERIAILPKNSQELVPSVYHDYGGMYPNVPLAVAGELQSMVSIQGEIRSVRPILRIAGSPITSHNVPAGDIKNWGAALVSYIDELEQANIRVEVTWISVSTPSFCTHDGRLGPDFVVRMTLKEADQPLDLDRIAFWMVNPAAQRRLQIAVKERNNKKYFYRNQFGQTVQYDIEYFYGEGHYGNPVSDEAYIATFLERDAIILCVKDGAPTPQDGIAIIRRQVEAVL